MSDIAATPESFEAPVASPEPVIEKLRGVPLIATWFVLVSAPWVGVWYFVKHVL